jgi:hypothetical protein
MDIDTVVQAQLNTKYWRPRTLEHAVQYIYGTYEIDDYQILLLDGSLKQDLKDDSYPATWKEFEIHSRLDKVAYDLNLDEKGRSVRAYEGIHHTGFYTELEDDQDHVYIELSVIEEATQRISSSSIRKVIKRNFSKYRITETSSVIDPETSTYFSQLYAFVKNTLTRRKFVVKVTKQELTYHMLIGKFRKMTCTR